MDRLSFRLPKHLHEALDQRKGAKGTAARLAILGAASRPELLPMAFKVRPYKDKDAEIMTIHVKKDKSIEKALDDLSRAYDISTTEVFRLALEAYIYKL